MSLITLLTDFGLKDGNVSVMKGVIASIAPHTHTLDISHLISPQAVDEAALILVRSAPYFPAGTIHVAVVDPGVGTSRRPMAAKLGEHYFVLPDNGLITLMMDYALDHKWHASFVHLNQPRYWMEQVSTVFHGRDIFAPIAAHIANGWQLTDLGSPIQNPVRLDLPQPQSTPAGFSGKVIHIDHFGNIATNIRIEHLGHPAAISVHLNNQDIPGLYRTFGDLPSGSLMALYGSTGNLIISEVNGSAALRLNTSISDPVEVEIFSHP